MNSALSIGLWIAQIGLAVAFLVHGWAMLTLPEHLQDRMAYMLDIPPRFRRFIGVAELLAGVGLILPRLTSIQPWLKPLAAMGLVIVMLGSIVFHLRRREYPNIVLNVLLLLIAGIVAFGLWLLLSQWAM
jgi:uncharacterized membrane protein YphA (DoxX/SURF4 family)